MYLIIVTDRNSGYKSVEQRSGSILTEIIVSALENYIAADIKELIENDLLDEYRDQLSAEMAIEVSIVDVETLERVL